MNKILIFHITQLNGESIGSMTYVTFVNVDILSCVANNPTNDSQKCCFVWFRPTYRYQIPKDAAYNLYVPEDYIH